MDGWKIDLTFDMGPAFSLNSALFLQARYHLGRDDSHDCWSYSPKGYMRTHGVPPGFTESSRNHCLCAQCRDTDTHFQTATRKNHANSSIVQAIVLYEQQTFVIIFNWLKWIHKWLQAFGWIFQASGFDGPWPPVAAVMMPERPMHIEGALPRCVARPTWGRMFAFIDHSVFYRPGAMVFHIDRVECPRCGEDGRRRCKNWRQTVWSDQVWTRSPRHWPQSH